MVRTLAIALATVAACTMLGGCIPALIATGVYAAHTRDQDRAAMHEHNLEREKAGLRPLTWEEWSRKNAKPADESRSGEAPAEEPGT